MFRVYRILKLLWLVCLIGAIGWAFVNSIVVVNAVVKASGAQGYREAVFVVDDVKYHPERTERHRGKTRWFPASWWANGQVAGREERYSLEGELSRAPQSQADLERMVTAGREFRVLYNPDMPSTVVQGETLRVIPFSADPAAEAAETVGRYSLYCLLPVAILILPWPVRRLMRTKPKKLAVDASKTAS